MTAPAPPAAVEPLTLTRHSPIGPYPQSAPPTYPRRTGVKGERGASAVEYGLIMAGIALVCIIAFQVLGVTLTEVFKDTDSEMCEPYCSSSAP